MENLLISLESTSDLPEDIIKKYNLKVIDMDYIVGDQEYSTKNSTPSTSGLYTKMRDGKKTSTSQINEMQYEIFFKELLKENKPILHLAFSSGLSNTYLSAVNVADKLNEKNENKIYVIDSLSACSGHGLLAVLTSEFAKTAKDIKEVIDFVEKTKMQLAHSFTVDNLKYLANGGRIKSSSAFFGNVLNIKPIMKVDEKGHLIVTSKVISRKKALNTMVDQFIQNHNKNNTMCYISHANCYIDARTVAKSIEEKTGIKPLITDLGPVIGCHSGPGTLAVFYLAEKR